MATNPRHPHIILHCLLTERSCCLSAPLKRPLANSCFTMELAVIGHCFGSDLHPVKRLVKDIRLSLPLTDVMNIARLTSLLSDMPRLSLPRPRLRYSRRLALLFHPNLTQNLYTLFFALLLALFVFLLF